MIPAPLDANFIRARVAVEVTLHQPMPRIEVKVVTGAVRATLKNLVAVLGATKPTALGGDAEGRARRSAATAWAS